MKKLLAGLVIIIAMIVPYSYQLPIMSTAEAIDRAEKHLQNPPKEWGNSFADYDWSDTPLENIDVSLTQKKNFWSNLTNKMKWEVTIRNEGTEQTVVMDAYTGKLIEIYGLLN